MTLDEQEALSRQHYGLWIVPLKSGAVAGFTHQNGKLLAICASLHELTALARPVPAFEERQLEKKANLVRGNREGWGTLDLSGIDL